ncbi:MAG: response regulator transcription factor [Saprospiraceae bacterium]|nr:response regulator transcription factor [Saprospiraceae bacterium]
MFHASLVGNKPEPLIRLINKAKAVRYFQCPIPLYSASEFLALGSANSFDLIFVDSDELSVDLFLIARIRRFHPAAEIIAIASAQSTTLLIALLKAGVDGFVLQNTTPSEFQFMLSSFYHGGPFMSSQTLKRLMVAAPSAFLQETI